VNSQKGLDQLIGDLTLHEKEELPKIKLDNLDKSKLNQVIAFFETLNSDCEEFVK